MTNNKRIVAHLRGTIPFVLTALLLAPTAQAADQLNCNNPISQLAMTRCAHLDYKAADRKLNAIYQRAITAMRKMDGELPGGLKGAEEALRVAQRTWVDFRDKACASYRFIARGGSMEPMLVGMCLTDLTRKRTKAVKQLVTEMRY